MAAALTASEVVAQRWGDSWLVGCGADSFWPQLQQYQAQLQTLCPQDVMVVESNPVRFLAAFLAACQQPCRIWLANPQWGLQEWQQVALQCQPDSVLGTVPPLLKDVFAAFGEASGNAAPDGSPGLPTSYHESAPTHSFHSRGGDRPISQILIPTGGSSGNLRFAIHTWETLAASVQGFQQHFHSSTVNAYCVLPLFHVSGLMQAMRCLLSGGTLTVQPFQTLLQKGAIAPSPNPSFLSLVPTQLQRLLKCDRDFVPWLRQFTAILLGGAPPWPSLLRTAREQQLPLAPTYGMTETAAQVATLLPHEFLAGNTSSGRSLPHAHITLCDALGRSLPTNQTGLISIEAASLAQGYSQVPMDRPLQTGDLGYLDEAGYLYVLGRQKTLIITGGEKVLPEEVEAAILAIEIVQDVAIVGIPDDDWGETVVAVVVPGTSSWSSDRLRHHLKSRISAYKIPKHWLQRSALPRNPQGKLNRTHLRQWVMEQLRSIPATTGSTLASEDSAFG